MFKQRVSMVSGSRRPRMGRLVPGKTGIPLSPGFSIIPGHSSRRSGPVPPGRPHS
ncbi:Uncharacterised protein [Bordetella pertussis]|nr:Uncharacterised protein [Bordetella pertussis]